LCKNGIDIIKPGSRSIWYLYFLLSFLYYYTDKIKLPKILIH
jgi:hypothetical protein